MRIIELLVLISLAANAQLPGTPSIINPGLIGPSVIGTYVPPTYIISEDCDGVGTPPNWVDTGSTDWDYATSPAPLFGTHSLRMAVSSTASVYTNFVALDECWAYVVVNMDSIGSSPYAVVLRDSAAGGLAYVRFLSGTSVRVANGTVLASSGSGVVASAATYHVWLHYLRGSGANGLSEAYVSTNANRPSSPTVSVSTGDAGNSVAQFRISTAATGTNYWDKIRFDDVEIGSNPE